MIAEKVRNHETQGYDRSIGLLLWVDVPMLGAEREEFEWDILDAAQAARRWFPSAWVCWLGRLYSLNA